MAGLCSSYFTILFRGVVAHRCKIGLPTTITANHIAIIMIKSTKINEIWLIINVNDEWSKKVLFVYILLRVDSSVIHWLIKRSTERLNDRSMDSSIDCYFEEVITNYVTDHSNVYLRTTMTDNSDLSSSHVAEYRPISAHWPAIEAFLHSQ